LSASYHHACPLVKKKQNFSPSSRRKTSAKKSEYDPFHFHEALLFCEQGFFCFWRIFDMVGYGSAF
jgi:hypothetical protein